MIVTALVAALCAAAPAVAAAEDTPDSGALPFPTGAFGHAAPLGAASEAGDAPTPMYFVHFGPMTPLGQQVPTAAGPAHPPLAMAEAAAAAAQDPAPRRRAVAITYSDGYLLRAKIHKYASLATLPLFGAQYLLGERLNDGSGSETVRAAHAGIATGMVGLFGVNTVTGLWNLIEGRKAPTGRGRRLLHGLLMLGADGGFVATGMLAPTNDGGGNRDLHRTVAITSVGIATAGYLLMLLGN